MEMTSLNNARVMKWTRLLQKKYRVLDKKYIIEGVHLLEEALRARASIECIAYDMTKGIPPTIQHYENEFPNIQWIGVSSSIVSKCTSTVTPQPIFAIVHMQKNVTQRLFLEQCSMVVVLDGVQDPGNVGTIIRSADGAGATAVVLGPGCADMYNPKTIRATMGSFFHLPIIQGDIVEMLQQAKQAGCHIVSTSLDANTCCYTYCFTSSIWLVIGNEGHGISDKIRDLVDDSLLIPMLGSTQSLNAAMAATILLFEAMRQRKFSGLRV